MSPAEALQEAITKAGSQSALAELIGVAQPRISEWLNVSERVGTPSFARLIEEKTGISRHLLRPDVFGPEPATSDLARVG